ncbi:MAG: hypothetical protein QF521_19295 [Alphaproteobacteria bacterium]|nr:hypothetical protein [Alphaproteobacteria bacterium]MDP6875674.1 hypothetical protein [Alphaproteobacteria bacterium]
MLYDYLMTPRATKYAIAGSIIAAMLLGHIIERYLGWDGAFMIIAGVTVAIWGAWLITVVMDRRR